MNPAFEIGRQTANTMSRAFAQREDTNAIESILSEAMQSDNPQVLQNSIGKILSQVSPERQGTAIQYLQNTYQNLKAKQEQEKARAAAQKEGLNPDLSPELQKIKYKNLLDQNALEYISEGKFPGQQRGVPQGTPSPVGQQPQIQGQQTLIQGQEPDASLFQGQQPQADQPQKKGFAAFSDDQLIALTSVPAYRDAAKAELQRRQEERKIIQQEKSDIFRSDLKRSEKVLDRADVIAEQIPQKQTAINLMKDAIASRNLSYFSPDNLAEITGVEGLRSPEGAIFKTAGKEYFLGNISRAGSRPNQWIEQQIADMMTKIGRSSEANFSVLRALENELDLDKARVRFTNEISDRLRSEGDLSQGKLGSILNKEMMKYADQKQDVLFNDLRAIKAIGEKTTQKYKPVTKGTPISDFMAQALLLQFENDPKKSRDEARKLGYSFE